MLVCLKTSHLGLRALVLISLTVCALALSHGEDAPVIPRAQHVIIMSIDGLRPDAIYQAHAPNLKKLIRQGAYCQHAQTVRPPATVPAHVSMLTGLDARRHKIIWNYFRLGYYRKTTMFSVAKEAGLTTAMFFSKQKLDFLANPNVVDFVYGERRHAKKRTVDTSAGALAAAFARQWSVKKYALTLIHVREPDDAGHANGWMSRQYLKAVATADRAVGSILATLQRAGSWPKTALIVTADHGGSRYGHRAAKAENMTIPWIAIGPGVAAGLLVDRTVRIYDTAPTALAFLGLTMPNGIDGSVVHEIFGIDGKFSPSMTHTRGAPARQNQPGDSDAPRESPDI